MNTVSLYGLRCANPAALADEIINGAYNVDENPLDRVRDFIENTDDTINFDTVYWVDVDLAFTARHSSSREPSNEVLSYLEGENIAVLVCHPRINDSINFVLTALSSSHTFQNVIVVEYDWPIDQFDPSLCSNLSSSEISHTDFPLPPENVFRVGFSSEDDILALRTYIGTVFGI